jgi:hypothetical protein
VTAPVARTDGGIDGGTAGPAEVLLVARIRADAAGDTI